MRPPFWERPGRWLWAVFIFSAALRLTLAWATQGTSDMQRWAEVAAGIRAFGVIGQYRLPASSNDVPPLMSWLVSLLWALCRDRGLPFPAVFRGVLGLADLGNAWLLGRVLEGRRWRWAAAAAYALHPVGILVSSFHGNVDCLVAADLLLCVLAASRGRPGLCGALLGLGCALKLPAAFAAPVFFFAFSRPGERLRLCAAAALAALAGYAPALLVDPAVVVERVFLYHGQLLRTPGGTWVWGIGTLLGLCRRLPGPGPALVSALFWYVRHSFWFWASGLTAYSWLRRGRRDAPELGATVAGAYAFIYAFSSVVAFQYFAWSAPFWLLRSRRFAVASAALVGAYLYAVHAYCCGSPWLLGPWDFIGRPFWPWPLLLLRDASVALFMAASTRWLLRAARP